MALWEHDCVSSVAIKYLKLRPCRQSCDDDNDHENALLVNNNDGGGASGDGELCTLSLVTFWTCLISANWSARGSKRNEFFH